MSDFNTMDNFDFENKTVFLRVDFNMPLDKKTYKIIDNTRIKLVLPTINELLEKNSKIVIITHQGRKDSWDFISLNKHSEELGKLLNKDVKFVNDIYGDKAKNEIKNLRNGEILVLDNVRKIPYETDKKSAEEHSKTEFIQNLYPLADYFINDAFAAAHRAQCSLIGFTTVLPSCAGRLMEKEITTLNKIIKNPKKPCIYLFGGAKYSDAIVTIERLLNNKIADGIILTGLPANAFLKVTGYDLGNNNEKLLLKEGIDEKENDIRLILKKFIKEIHLPIDVAISENNNRKEIDVNDLPSNDFIYDIGEKTINKYKEILETAKTIFISGPCGVFENDNFRKGTKELFNYIANLDVFSIVGGGHTVAAVEQMKLSENFSHISTGGGSLERFMMGEKLVVIEALKESKKNNIITIN